MRYWQKRNLQAQAALANKSAKEIDKQLDIYYRRAIGKVVKDFEATYDKLQAAMADGAAPTPADLYKLDKYWQMQNQLKEELQKLGNKEVELYSKKFTDLYKAEYEAIAIKGQKSFTKISTEAAREMISSVWVADGKSWSERIWDNTTKLAETLNAQLVHCVVTGKKTTELKKLLQDRFNSSYYEADRLARTEIAHIQTEAAKKRYADYGIGEVEIWADEDERRCDVCGKLHKKRYPVGAAVPIPAHPNCRCAIIPVVDDEPKTATQATAPQQEPKKAQTAGKTFAGAKTVEQAQAQADRFVKSYKSKYSGNVNYKGLDVAQANSVNKAITEVFEAYSPDVFANIETMNFREKKWASAVESGTAAAYQWGNGGTLYINQKLLGTKKLEKKLLDYTSEMLETVISGADLILSQPDLRETQRRYIQALVDTRRQCVSQTQADFVEATTVHEMGHALHDKIFHKRLKSYKNPTGLDLSASMEKYSGKISGYATSNSHEYIAESFTAYWYGETENLDPELVRIFDEERAK